MEQNIIYTNEVDATLDTLVQHMSPNKVFVLTDSNTRQFVLPLLMASSTAVAGAVQITMTAGEGAKSLETVNTIYQKLINEGATRHSLLLNVGGGVVTDLGGYVAATFKRGMRFVNVPTTLLAAVDAAVGGKTGVNFGGLKNQIGVFAPADAVIISTTYFNTLNRQELLSGYAEMIKHALLSSPDEFARVMRYPIGDGNFGSQHLLDLLKRSVQVKEGVVAQDPTERGLRKSLNLGHTVGHAFEALAMHRSAPVPHGYAVAWGLVVEAVLSHMRQGFGSAALHTLATHVRENFGAMSIGCKDYDRLIGYMRQDKKNASAEHINFTLLKAPGQIVLDVTVPEDDIKNALDIYRDLMGL